MSSEPRRQPKKKHETDPKILTARLHAAVRIGALEEAAYVIAHGANVNGLDERGWSPLLNATHRRHLDMLELLLAEGANANMAYAHGFSAVHYAAVGVDDPAALKILVEKGNADPNVVTSVDHGRCTALIRACTFGLVKITKYLTTLEDVYVDLHVEDHMDKTAFDRAREKSWSDCEFLIRRAERQRRDWGRRRVPIILQDLFKPEEGLAYSEHTARGSRPRHDMAPPVPSFLSLVLKRAMPMSVEVIPLPESDDEKDKPLLLVGPGAPKAPEAKKKKKKKKKKKSPSEIARAAADKLAIPPGMELPEPSMLPFPITEEVEEVEEKKVLTWEEELHLMLHPPPPPPVPVESEEEKYRKQFLKHATADTLASLMRLDTARSRCVLQMIGEFL